VKNLDSTRLKLRNLELRPLMIGGMGVDISSADLALEGARLGAVGHISDAMVPYLSDKYFKTRNQSSKLKLYSDLLDSEDKTGLHWDTDVVYESAKRYVQATMSRKKGRGGVFINVMEKLTMGAPKDTLQARLRGALDGGIEGVSLSAGLHNGTLKLIEDHPRFHDVNIGVIVSSARALSIFLRGAARCNRYPDYIVVEGPLAGGHLGFGMDWAKYDLRSIVQEVIALLAEEQLNIPVIPAGGIFTGADAVEYLKLGASAVQVATRFTISEECGLPRDVKQKYLLADEADVVVNLTSPTGYPMRMLSSSPSLVSNIKPNCEALGYLLDQKANCSYRQAYAETGTDADGKKLPVQGKMCICYHFMKCQCYTCGHNVFRLKDTTSRLGDGTYFLPRAEHIIEDYLRNASGSVALPLLNQPMLESSLY